MSAGNVRAVHVYPCGRGGNLTVIACSQCGRLYTWLDAATHASPQQCTLAQASVEAEDDALAGFYATPYTGADAPGFFGLLALTDGSLIFVSVTSQSTMTREIEAGSIATQSRGGLLKAIGSAVAGQYAGFSDLINLNCLRRSHASKLPAVAASIAHHVC